MKQNLLALGAVFVLALILVGLTFSASAQDEERADYVLINGTEPKTLDPAKATGQPEGRLLDCLFEGLTYRHPKTLRPTPGSAESWSTADGRKYVFKMRPGLTWHNGDPLTAHDFVYSWKRFLDPETAAEYGYLLHLVRHGEAFHTYGAQIDSIRGAPKTNDDGEPILDDAGNPQREEGILAKFDTLLEENKELDGEAWQAWIDETKVRGALKGTQEAGVRDALEIAEEGRMLTDAEKAAFREGVLADVARRERDLIAARKHLGVDQGFWSNEDGSEFHLELVKYAPYFLDLTCFYPLFPVHKETVEAHGDGWFKPETFVGNGPFKMAHWYVNQKIRVLRNDAHWDAPNIALRHVDLLSLEDPTTMMNLCLTGVVDWAPSGYPPDLIDVLKSSEYFYSNPGFVVYYYRINVTRTDKMLNDVAVRKALSIGFSRRKLTDKVLRKGDFPAAHFVPPGVVGYDQPDSFIRIPETEAEEEALFAEANKLLDDAGYPKGSDGMRAKIPTLTLIYNTSESHEKIAEYIADQWKVNLGIKVVPANQEWQSYLQSQQKLNYDVSRAGWIGDYVDPNTFLDMWITKGGNNQTGWTNARYDRLLRFTGNMDAFVAEAEEVLGWVKEPDRLRNGLESLEAASDDAERTVALNRIRLDLFREAEAILLQDEMPIIPIYFYQVSGLVNPGVEGFYTTVQDLEGNVVGANLQDLHPVRYVRTPRMKGR